MIIGYSQVTKAIRISLVHNLNRRSHSTPVDRCSNKVESFANHNPEDPIHIDAADARGADVVLRKKRERWIFVGGLVGLVLLVLILRRFA
ncbi:hypothetical protein [Qipengyuania sp.]|uniref:hypothetical protein n=1 Tax=Qipengyuania sp. TaxID=2004515 RepID=UPI0035C79FD4